MLLAPTLGAASLAAIDLDLVGEGAETTLADPALERLRTGNAAARGLPILAGLAAGRPAQATLEWLPDLWLAVSAAPHGAA
jgi:hypothetical protein